MIMPKDLPKIYDPQKTEDEIYQKWEKSGCFNPDNLDLPENAKTYTIVLPPPNITDKLHLGHISMLAIEDLLIRYHRMKGFRTLWIPGTDHAAIATQNVVEKKLLKEKGLTRHDLGREKFLKEVRKFLKKTQKTILRQIKKTGASLNWSREAFTLDAQRKKAVHKMFVDMYDAGIIYRGERIVNWCPRCHSTLADDEIEYKEQKAKFYTFKYSDDFPFAISTTRPETKLGDTAVAVNPKDKRYKKYIGKTFEVDFCGVKLKLKTISDRNIDMNFGTGALGVTPAHSMTDWQMAEKNNLEIIKVIGEDGKIREGFKNYSGKTTAEAREMIIKELKKQGLLEKEEEIENNLSLCYRCNTPIEPLPSKQWFVSVDKKIKRLGDKSLKEKAIEVVKKKQIEFIPKRFKKRYLDWMENLRDWCISRQIWFGHQIPVWYKRKTQNAKRKTWELKIYGEDIFNAIKENKKTIETRAGKSKKDDKYWGDFKQGDVIKFSLANEKTDSIISSVAPTEKVIEKVMYFETINEMLKTLDLNKITPDSSTEEYKKTMESFPGFKERLKKYGVWAFELKNDTISGSGNKDQEIYIGMNPPEGKNWIQDPDTLDTWFSSGMWTFSTLGWPRNFKDNKKSGDLKKFHPTQILETGYEILTLWVSRMVMMSLFALNEIPFEKVYLHGMVLDKHGKKMSKSKGNGIDPLDVIKKFGADSVRLTMLIGNTPGNDVKISEEKIESFRNFTNKLWNISRYIIQNFQPNSDLKINTKKLTFVDKWILIEMKNLITNINNDLANHRFSQAGERLKDFTWNSFADWYLEVSKFEKNKKEKSIILNIILKDLLKLWHPFIPFVTENIWGKMENKNLIMIEKWPEKEKYFEILGTPNEADGYVFDKVQSVIIAIRNARAENKIEPGKKINAIIYAGEHYGMIKNEKILIKSLRTGIDELEIKRKGQKISKAICILESGMEIYLVGATGGEKERAKNKKELDNLKKYAGNLEGKLKNKNFTRKAPEKIVQREKENLKKAEVKILEIEKYLKSSN